MEKYNYDIDFEYNSKHYIYNTITSALAELDSKTFDEYSSVKKGLCLDNDIQRSFSENGFLLGQEIEKDILQDRKSLSYDLSSTLNITIAPTLNCNLNCIYCFQQNHEDESCTLDEDTLLSFIKQFSIKNLNITWFGGEPTLKLNLITEISKSLIMYCSDNDIRYSASIISNGLLLNDDTLNRLIESQVNKFQLTMDGLKHTHNERKNGGEKLGDSFSNVVHLIKSATDKSIKISLRVNIDKENYDEIYDLIDYLEPIFNKNISIHFSKIEQFTNKNLIMKNEIFTEEEFSLIEVKLYKYLLKKKMINSLDILYPYSKSNYCGATESNSFIISNDGFLYKCWCDMEDKSKSIGTITSKQNNLHDNYFVAYSALEDSECKNCTMLPLCWGGC